MSALDVLADWPVPEAAAAVLTPGGVQATHGDVGASFRLASVTKPIVARAAQVAVEEGAVDLDGKAAGRGDGLAVRRGGTPGVERALRQLVGDAQGAATVDADAGGFGRLPPDQARPGNLERRAIRARTEGAIGGRR